MLKALFKAHEDFRGDSGVSKVRVIKEQALQW